MNGDVRATARALWRCFETIHAVTYFAPESTAATAAIGVNGFWRTYFGYRAAPLGACPAATVTATFFGFSPTFVARAVPDIWSRAEPSTFLRLRSASAAAALRRLVPDIDEVATESAIVEMLTPAAITASSAGRPLYAANRALPPVDDPVAQLWQTCTTLREHRGDGHNAALTTAGLDATDALRLYVADTRTPGNLFTANRGWTETEWSDAYHALIGRGFINGQTTTAAGHTLRADIEHTTDELAITPFVAFNPADRQQLIDTLTPAATAIAHSGLIPYPNPIGVDRPPVTGFARQADTPTENDTR